MCVWSWVAETIPSLAMNVFVGSWKSYSKVGSRDYWPVHNITQDLVSGLRSFRVLRCVAFTWFTILRWCMRIDRWLTPRLPAMENDSDDDLELVLLLALYRRRKKRCRGTRRSMRVRFVLPRRQQQGEYHNLLQEMCTADPHSHFRYLRMSREWFDCLLSEVLNAKWILRLRLYTDFCY